ncbi:unnamed protein product [Rotaria socialis]|uniref:Alpha-mannosidase n=1 Tax=Rotaria socialis TaxID=392032 RepID=A0A821IDW5_9BILA|nr:unnamed protein product [Rotaria socialis]
MYISNYCAILLLIVALCFGVSQKSPNGCGYDSCNVGVADKLNVHIVPHTHDDVGWLKTVDQYYYGARNDIQHACVQYILDSVIQALLKNPERRFIYVEMAFFWRWWNEQSDDVRETVKELVNDGRLEFISGGWCMNDEGITHYNSIIDQHSLGAEFLRDQFGECARPKIGWQIDPFGHSREVASLFAQMGFDGLFFGRVDYQDYQHRTMTKTMEMVWKGSANLNRESWLFTGVLPRVYEPPDSICFDQFCNDQPVMDDSSLHDYNVPERVQAFINAAHDQARGYATNHIIMTMGSDFQYEYANVWFKNLDKLIKYVNAQQVNGSDVNVFYSTPSCYLYALNKAGLTWPSKTDDFFPIAQNPHGFWTGYFTSRAALKRYERYSNNILQATRQLNALSEINLRSSEAMGVAQHHDAVSGTEKQHVADDYAQRLSQGIDIAADVINSSYAKLLPKESGLAPPLVQFLCHYSNISECLPIEGQIRFTLTLWNPTIHPVTYYAHVPAIMQYSIRDPTGNIVPSEFLPIPNITKNIPGRTSSANYQHIFKTSLPALGFNTYYFEMIHDEKIEKKKVMMTQNETCTLENEHLRIEFDDQGNLHQITNLEKGIATSFTTQGFYWYTGFPGNNSRSEFQASGAYFFRPLMPDPQPVSTMRSITCTKTETVQSALIIFNNWASQEVNLFQGSAAVEFEWTIGPIPIDDYIGKEIIVRYDTDIQSKSTYYTDANGREVLERKVDYRPTWNYTVNENISGNYYPISSRIWIKDEQRQLTVLTDRSEGGGSIHDGSIEIMVHRRLLYDDNEGVGEPLNETAFGTGLVVRGKHFLILEPPENSALIHRVGAQQLFMNPIATYALPQNSYADYESLYRQTWSALSDSMPLNVHLLTFDQLGPKQFLIRIEHYFELNEDEIYSQPVQIDLQDLFKSLGTITDLIELTLGANLPLSQLHRLDWMTNNNESSHVETTQQTHLKDTMVMLNPMQIKTFQVTL